MTFSSNVTNSMAVSNMTTWHMTYGQSEAVTLMKSEEKSKISADDFEYMVVIGRGSFGKVYQVMKKDTK